MEGRELQDREIPPPRRLGQPSKVLLVLDCRWLQASPVCWYKEGEVKERAPGSDANKRPGTWQAQDSTAAGRGGHELHGSHSQTGRPRETQGW